MTNILLQLYSNQRLSHASILNTTQTTACRLVDEFAEELQLSPADYLQFRESEPLKIKDAREIRRFAGMTRYNSPIKLIFIADARQLTTEAANALLKTLEEPPDQTYLVLATNHLDDLLLTVRSRCQIIDLGTAIIETNETPALKKLALPEYFAFAKQLADTETSLRTIFEHWQSDLSREPTTYTVKQQAIILRYLPYTEFNVNRRLLLDNFFLDLYTID